jgi:hypothetical protein
MAGGGVVAGCANTTPDGTSSEAITSEQEILVIFPLHAPALIRDAESAGAGLDETGPGGPFTVSNLAAIYFLVISGSQQS